MEDKAKEKALDFSRAFDLYRTLPDNFCGGEVGIRTLGTFPYT